MSGGGLWNDYGAGKLEYHDALLLARQQHLTVTYSISRMTLKRSRRPSRHIFSHYISLLARFRPLLFGRLNDVCIRGKIEKTETNQSVNSTSRKKSTTKTKCGNVCSLSKKGRNHRVEHASDFSGLISMRQIELRMDWVETGRVVVARTVPRRSGSSTLARHTPRTPLSSVSATTSMVSWWAGHLWKPSFRTDILPCLNRCPQMKHQENSMTKPLTILIHITPSNHGKFILA